MIAKLDRVPARATYTPPLKWAGGKRWQLPHVQPLWEANDAARLVEPFCGGLAIALGLAPDRALLNDINFHVVNFYRWVQRGLCVNTMLINSADAYYACRTRFNDLLATGQTDSAEAAVLFYYLNRTGYNGLCRFNRSGEFNVPFGRYARLTYRNDFDEYRGILRGWTFTSMDFEELELLENDFVYADPPYDVEFTHYSQQRFGWQHQVRLAQWLTLHRGPVVLANQATSRVVHLYRELGYHVSLLKAPRRISCTGDRAPADEVLATRNLNLI